MKKNLLCERTEYGRQIIVRISAKVFAALSLLVVAWVVQPREEHYKNGELLRAEIEVKRLLVIAEVWSHLYCIEAVAKDIMATAAETATKRKSPEELTKQLPRLHELSAELSKRSAAYKNYLENHRFWVDPELYRRLVQHNNNYYLAIDYVMRDDIQAFTKLVPQLNATRQEMYKYLETFR